MIMTKLIPTFLILGGSYSFKVASFLASGRSEEFPVLLIRPCIHPHPYMHNLFLFTKKIKGSNSCTDTVEVWIRCKLCSLVLVPTH